MTRLKVFLPILAVISVVVFSCKEVDPPVGDTETYPAIRAMFGSAFDVDNLPNYADQSIPNYINRDNVTFNSISNEGAILGRVLFYDKALSVDNTIACASCHQQQFAFSDTARASVGVNGTTGRHSMRLVNARFSEETRFFWDERANTLEEQTTMPIQDHAEMGFSGENGDPDIEDLIDKLAGLDYYKELFTLAFGNEEISESKMQLALSQFIRSIQSFDSKFDVGMASAPNIAAPFQNFTQTENTGKMLFIGRPQFDQDGVRTGGGLGCAGCHRPPEFDIDPNSGHNGVIGSINGGPDFDVTRSPSLRDVVRADGSLNGPLMHTGGFGAIRGVVAHYNNIPRISQGLDPRLRPNNIPQDLNLTQDEISALVQFITTLSGSDMYTNAKWSDPF